jgi:hypothetical protein
VRIRVRGIAAAASVSVHMPVRPASPAAPGLARRKAGAALVMAMIRWDYFWIANVIYLGFVLWAIAGSVVRLVAYRRGL